MSRCAGRPSRGALRGLAGALVVSLVAGCDRGAPVAAEAGPETGPETDASRSLHFTDVSSASGIDLVMTCGATPSREILEVDGGGLALIDYDRDGDLDLFIANGATLADPEHGPGSRLYENLGGVRFRDVTTAAGIRLTRWAMGAAVGDYDGDGFDDLYVACYGPNVLLRNLGDGRFEDTTAAAGVGDARWGSSTAFGDLDDDDDLDLYVVNYLEFDVAKSYRRASYKGVPVMSGPHGLPPVHDILYENLGDGTFRDVTEVAGCLVEKPSFGLNLVIVDFDGDGRPDIYVGNDSMENFLFRNLGGLKFESAGMLSGAAANNDGAMQATMGIAIGDVSGNGRPDLFSTNFSSDTNTLHVNADGRFFEDRTQAYGLGMVSRTLLGWTCGLFDFDHDGDEDLVAFNGHVYPEATRETMDSNYEQPPLLFAREGRRFEPVGPEVAGDWLARAERHRAGVFGDLDGDGDVDIIVSRLNGPLQVLRNDAAGGRWLIVELRDGRPGVGNRHALGAKVELYDDERTLTRWIFSGGGFQSSSAPYAHLAWPWATTPRLRVTWPGGRVEERGPVDLAAHVVIDRSE